MFVLLRMRRREQERDDNSSSAGSGAGPQQPSQWGICIAQMAAQESQSINPKASVPKHPPSRGS